MKKNFLPFLLCLSTLDLFQQTKLIEHRSHSMNTFFSVYSAGNFGMAPEKFIRTARLDSLIVINDTVALMVTSEFCKGVRSEKERLWKPGRDSVFHHPVFTKKNDIKTIKNVIRTTYNFRNNVDEVVFIGFEEQNPKNTVKKDEQGKTLNNPTNKRKNDAAPVIINVNNNGNSGQPPMEPALFFPLIFFLLTPLLFFYNYRFKLIRAANELK
jgi:hypothetical protein